MFTKRLDAPQYIDLFKAQRANLTARRGSPNALTNDELLQLVDYWQRVMKAHGHKMAEWYPLTKIALGYHAPGDKFRIDSKHARREVGPSIAKADVWPVLLAIALRADATRQARPFVDFTPNKQTGPRFRRRAAQAWAVLKRNRRRGIEPRVKTPAVTRKQEAELPTPPKPIPLPTPPRRGGPPKVTPPKLKPPKGVPKKPALPKGTGAALLVLLAALLLLRR